MLKPVINPIEEIFEDSKNGKILLYPVSRKWTI